MAERVLGWLLWKRTFEIAPGHWERQLRFFVPAWLWKWLGRPLRNGR